MWVHGRHIMALCSERGVDDDGDGDDADEGGVLRCISLNAKEALCTHCMHI